MSSEQLGQLINLIASITLFEMMVAIGLGVSVADVPALPLTGGWSAKRHWRATSSCRQWLPVC